MEVSIIISTKGREAIFNETLACALQAIQNLSAEILIVNDSKTSTPKFPVDSRVRLLSNPREGVAAARNHGARNSTKELLLFLDNDILISEHSLKHIIALHEKNANVCYNLNWEYPDDLKEKLDRTAFGRFLKAHEMTSFRGWYNDKSWESMTIFRSPAVASFHLSILRTDFDRAGGYQEEFPFAGFEDYDFPKRLRKHDVSMFIDSSVTVYHNETDRLEMENWLMNWERRSASRKAGVKLGYSELTIYYNPLKKLLLKTGLGTFPLMMAIFRYWPNIRIGDGFVFQASPFCPGNTDL